MNGSRPDSCTRNMLHGTLSSPAHSVKHKCMAAVLKQSVCGDIPPCPYTPHGVHTSKFNHDIYCCYLLCNVLQNILQGVMSVYTGWDEGQSRQLKQRSRLWCDSGRSEGNKSQTRRNLWYHWTSLARHQKNRIIWSSTQRSAKLVSAFSLWFT